MRNSKSHIILVLLCICLAGCGISKVVYGPVNSFSQSEDFRLLDLRPFTDQGFLFTPFDFAGEYDAVGPISVEVYPATERQMTGTLDNIKWEWKADSIATMDVIRLLYQRARALDANGVIDFKLEPAMRPEVVQINESPELGTSIVRHDRTGIRASRLRHPSAIANQPEAPRPSSEA